MAPVAVSSPPKVVEQLKTVAAETPVEEAFDIRSFSHFDCTPSIGTEFRAVTTDGRPAIGIRDILGNDRRIKGLGRLVSERGVVFFRNAVISTKEQVELVQALGVQGGKPADSGLHVHPLTLPDQVEGDEIALISNRFVFGKAFQRKGFGILDRRLGKDEWHSDITYEAIPSDYATLQIRTLPEVGGDTLWASAYEAFDRLSPTMQKFLEGLTAMHQGDGFLRFAEQVGVPVREPRGAPGNIGQSLEAIHPVVRTHPITGWKGLFVNRNFTKHIVELTPGESANLLNFLFDHVSSNHDLQVRFRWEKDSLAIWDNRCTFHAATADLDDGHRQGTRSISLGERPYLDPASLTRRQALEKAKEAVEGQQ